MNLLRSNIWPAFFQFSLAMSRLVDVDPEAFLNGAIDKFSWKQLKLIQMFEVMNPERTQEELDKEYSEDIKKIMDERKPKEEDEAAEGDLKELAEAEAE